MGRVFWNIMYEYGADLNTTVFVHHLTINQTKNPT